MSSALFCFAKALECARVLASLLIAELRLRIRKLEIAAL
jgi:hypothetical protein